jgi:glycosyltransferase involved in cell wall biosynthesis
MRIVICWSHISGYMSACWRALAATSGVELQVIAFQPVADTFAHEVAQGFNCRFLTADEQRDEAKVQAIVREYRPDVLVISGWNHRIYRGMLTGSGFASAAKWLTVDTPWRGTLKQQFGRIALRGVVGHADRVFVPGERAWQYMRRLGVPEAKIRRGLYGIDYAALAPLREQRATRPGGWPKRFLFVGRYHPQKGIATLVEAYAKYRAAVSDPWPLGCCGNGPLEPLLAGRDGIENFGFRQPDQVVDILRDHGAFVLASEFDPWPLVVVEACAAGLPVVCTESCGSAVELVRPYHNGLTVATGDSDALARALRWMHEHADQLPEMGRRGSEMASAYSAQVWAVRWAETMREFQKA